MNLCACARMCACVRAHACVLKRWHIHTKTPLNGPSFLGKQPRENSWRQSYPHSVSLPSLSQIMYTVLIYPFGACAWLICFSFMCSYFITSWWQMLRKVTHASYLYHQTPCCPKNYSWTSPADRCRRIQLLPTLDCGSTCSSTLPFQN